VTEGLAQHRATADRDGEAFALCALARLRRRTGKVREASEAAAQALAAFEGMGDARGIAAARMQLGNCAALGNDTVAAAGHFRESFAAASRIGYVTGEATALGALGDLALALGRPAEAEPWTAQAVAREEHLRGGLRDLPDAALKYGERTTPRVRRHIGVLLELGRIGEAFAWAQRAKAAFLADATPGAGAGGEDPELAKERERLRARESALTVKWLALAGPGARGRTSKEHAALSDERGRLEADWAAYEERRRLAMPRSAAAGPGSGFVPAKAAALLPARTALLEMVFVDAPAGASLAMFVVARGGTCRVLRIAPERTRTLLADVGRLRAACSTKPGGGGGTPWRVAAAAVHRQLIAPVLPWLAGIDRLVVCPDGALWDVPFAVLADRPEGNACLWDRFALSMAPGAAALAAARRARTRPGRSPAKGELLVVADPDTGAGPAGVAFPRLPYARIEAEAIHSVFPRSTVRTGVQADEAGVAAMLGGYRRLHFATHAVVDAAAPLLGGVVLAGGKGGADGLLTAREWMGMDLGAELLVLSACGSGRGRTVAGEGVVGLAWAAFLAGIPAQVVSQWSVDDAATAQLMAAFYGGLRRGMPVDAALRSAARELRSRPGLAHPFHWAPFVALGDVWSSWV